jgi:hypothetical protein
MIGRLNRLDSALTLSGVDAYNLKLSLLNNLEWAHGNREEYAVRDLS